MRKYLDLSSLLGGALVSLAVCLLRAGFWMRGQRVNTICLEGETEGAEG